MSDEHGTYIPIADEEEIEIPIINETSTHSHEGEHVHDYDADTGILQSNNNLGAYFQFTGDGVVSYRAYPEIDHPQVPPYGRFANARHVLRVKRVTGILGVIDLESK